MKKIVNELEGLPTKIDSVKFGILTEQRARELSVLKVSKREIYDINTEKPMVNGVLDPKLGLSSPGELCETCNKTLQECTGHFGHIELTLPVFHPGYQKMLVKILQTVCKKCARILLPEKKIFLYRISGKNIFNNEILFNEAKKNQTCFYCGYTNGVVKKGIGTKIIYSGYDLNPLVVKSLLSQIEDYDLLNFNKKGCNELEQNIFGEGTAVYPSGNASVRPHLNNNFSLFTDIVVNTVLVPPACSRPSVKTEEFGSNEDDLTIKLSEMVQLSITIVNSLTTSSLTLLLNDWELLNNTFSSYISGNTLRSLLTRLKGKHGRFRNNLSGKRSDYTARTVISPDPLLSIEQVGIPLQIAKVLTVPEKVTEFNIESLRRHVLNGPKKYPGANFVINKENKRISTLYNKKIFLGDIVERHLVDNDRVLFNRQPSLHRLSILSHFVKVVPNKTFCFNVSVCAPYNADFDGDEMNVHVPQTIFARAECNLMRIKENLRSPKDNQLIIMPNQDFITSMYLIGREYFDEVSFYTYLFEVCHASQDYEIAKSVQPSVLRPTRIYTGQQLLSAIFKKHKLFELLMTKRMLKQCLSQMSNSEIVIAENCVARVSARFIGERGFSIGVDDLEYKNQGNKAVRIKSLISECVKEIDPDNIAELSSVRDKMSKTIKLLPDNSALIMAESGSKGSKINITQMMAMVGQQVINGQRVPLSYSGRSLPHYHDGEAYITETSATTEGAASCCSGPSAMENDKMGRTVDVPVMTGSACNENGEDSPSNRDIAFGTMNDDSSRTGSVNNTHEIDPGIDAQRENDLKHCEEKMLFRGFIKNSFFTGLNAFEFFFHAISGREGLVDTAVKTAETGYMQRRLIKALEDLKLCFDGSVRGTDCVIQFPNPENSYFRKGFQPGDALGAIAAQSIGEPGTQMTLKTFHFAGVGSMNITLGVPRLKEIINASACSTPVIRITGVHKGLNDMRQINDAVQPLRIENVIEAIEINISESIYVDFRTKIKYLSLNETIRERLEKRYKSEAFIHNGGVRMYLDVNQDSIYTLNDMKQQVGKIFLRGIATVTGTVFNNVETENVNGKENERHVDGVTGTKDGDRRHKRARKDSSPVCADDTGPEFELLAEGTGLQEILGMPNVKSALTNNIIEIELVLGIEAAQRSIVNEIVFTLKSHGIEINVEHITLLADLMCFKGKVNGITRFGIKNFKSSPLMLASFEQTGEHLFDAAANNKRNEIAGVSDSIIVGGIIPVGTGGVSIYHDDGDQN